MKIDQVNHLSGIMCLNTANLLHPPRLEVCKIVFEERVRTCCLAVPTPPPGGDRNIGLSGQRQERTMLQRKSKTQKGFDMV